MKAKELIKKYEIILASAEIESSYLDCLLLLQFITGYSKEKIIIYNPVIDEKIEGEYKKLINRRAELEPVAYIIGNKEFYSLDFKVDKDVLIPRPETEFIIDEALKQNWGNRTISVLDIGTGSGCIIVTLLKKIPNSIGFAIDISNNAINLAKQNSIKHSILEKIQFETIDIKDFVADRKFDLIVSNPPYISSAEYQNLAKNVRDYEPQIALTDNHSGYVFYEIIAEKAKELIAKNGIIIVEFGMGQSKKIEEIFASQDWQCKKIIRDLNNIERVGSFVKI